MPASDKTVWTFAGAMMDFFGKVSASEMRALSEDDKAYFRHHLTKEGYNFGA